MEVCRCRDGGVGGVMYMWMMDSWQPRVRLSILLWVWE